MIVPRDYQANDLDFAMAPRTFGKRPIHCSPTGSGKTVIQALIAKEEMERGNETAILTPRIEIFKQTHSMLNEVVGEQNVGTLRAGVDWYRARPIHVISWTTLIARLRKSKAWFPDVRRLIVDECFTGDVEIMTEHGFVRFDRYSGEPVAQVSDDGCLSFIKPTAIIRKPYSGDVVRFYGKKSIDLTVTANHEMVVLRGAMRKKKKAADIVRRDFLPVCAWSVRKTGSLLPIERLLIALQADGSLRRTTTVGHSIDFHLTKQRKIDRLTEICRTGGFVLNEVKGQAKKRRFLVHQLPKVSKNLWDSFSLELIDQGDARAIIEEMVHWDGHVRSNGNYYFSSTSKRACDFYQAVAIIAGYKTNMTVQHDDRKETYKDVHRLFISKDCDRIGMQSVSKEVSKFNGTVYCVTVPDGRIVVRRNGKPVVTGNCHLSMAPRILDILEHYAPRAYVDGYTATPGRQTGKGLGRYYTEIKHVTSVRQLIKEGYLAPCEYWAGKYADVEGIPVVRGDFQQKELSGRSVKLVGDVVDNWLRLARDRHTIVFAVDIAHAEALCDRFLRVGIRAACIHTGMDAQKREEVVEQFKAGEIQVLCNVTIASYGFDAPSVNCVVCARPTKSLVLWLQMLGRGMRPAVDEDGNPIRDPEHPDYKTCMILDHANNTRTLGHADDLFRWRLDVGKPCVENWSRNENSGEEKETQSHECEQCSYLFSGSRVCPKCGWEVPFRKRDIAVQEANLVRISGQIAKELPDGFPPHEILWRMLKYHAREKDYQFGWVLIKFKELTETTPPKSWNKLAATPPSERVKNWLIKEAQNYARKRSYAKRSKARASG